MSATRVTTLHQMRLPCTANRILPVMSRVVRSPVPNSLPDARLPSARVSGPPRLWISPSSESQRCLGTNLEFSPCAAPKDLSAWLRLPARPQFLPQGPAGRCLATLS